MIISKQNSTHYQWGNHCDAWTLLQSENVIIKEEKMPPNTEEQFHYHNETAQFFYVLDGKASFYIANDIIYVSKNEGINIPVKVVHKISNETSTDLRFLVISFPGNLDDRVNSDKKQSKV